MTHAVEQLPHPSSRAARAARAAGIAAWLAFCFWLFSFWHSDLYFSRFDCSRWAAFLASMVSATIIPFGAIRVWHRFRTPLGVFVGQSLLSVLALIPLIATAATLPRLRGACHLSGDDAMGVGIHFLLLCACAAAFVVILTIASVVRRRRQRTSPASD